VNNGLGDAEPLHEPSSIFSNALSSFIRPAGRSGWIKAKSTYPSPAWAKGWDCANCVSRTAHTTQRPKMSTSRAYHAVTSEMRQLRGHKVQKCALHSLQIRHVGEVVIGQTNHVLGKLKKWTIGVRRELLAVAPLGLSALRSLSGLCTPLLWLSAVLLRDTLLVCLRKFSEREASAI
jgi:hypothetical protein